MSEQPVDNSVDKAVSNAVDSLPGGVDNAERLAAQKRRNTWLGLALFGLVVIIALVSALRLAENIQRVSGA